jgi:hypothetical protein
MAHAKLVLPPPTNRSLSREFAAFVAAVVCTVSVVEAGALLRITTEVVLVPPAPKEHVGGETGLAIVAVTVQDTLTRPINPPTGVRVIVAVLPVVAPALRLMFPLLERLKDPVGVAGITVIEMLAEVPL